MTGLPAQALRYYAPSPALAPFVTNLFAWTGVEAAFAAWMPAIESQVLVRLGGSVDVRYPGTPVTTVARPMLVGPMGATMHIRTTADFTAVGAGLTARGYLRLIGVSAGLLDERATDLAALLGAPAVAALVEALGAIPAHAARVRGFEAWLRHRLTSAERCDRRAAALDDWLAGQSPVRLAELHSRLGLSGRQAERVARDLMGLGPKGLAMRQRALRAASRIAAATDPAAALHAAGYADQSHMIRDFRRFIGVTPARLGGLDLQRHVFEDPERVGVALGHGAREGAS